MLRNRVGKLQSDVREYLACQKISTEYNSQLEQEQKSDLRKKMDDASTNSEASIVAAYSLVIKFSVKNGAQVLQLRHFKSSLDNQVNTNLLEILKEEEWMLESVGLSTLNKNGLLPSKQQGIRAKDIFEAFLRFDDKPMVTGPEAVSRSILKYCMNGEFCIATGDGNEFTRFYFKESVPFFDVFDNTYWLIDQELKPEPEAPYPNPTATGGTNTGGLKDSGASETTTPSLPEEGSVKSFNSISIHGKVALENYTALFNYFITPFAMSGNKIEIDVSFKIKSSAGSPIDESKQQYKSAKEAAKQLGLDFRGGRIDKHFTMQLYHGTSSFWLSHILKRGLGSRKYFREIRHPKVWSPCHENC